MLTKPKIRHFVATITVLFVSFNAFSESLPETLIGTWQVEEVHLNTSVGRSTEYTWDDPRLKRRVFTFTRNDVTDDVDDELDHCINPVAREISTSFRDIISRSVGGYTYPPSPNSDPARDYKLHIADSKGVQALSLTCSTGIWQGDLGISSSALGNEAISGAWIVLNGDETLYLRWRDETILRLQKINPRAPIQASFPCSKAVTSTEHAICHSYQLAAFDKSIADAYKSALRVKEASDDNAVDIGREQRQWIKQRDACGANASCILKLMRARLAALVADGST